MQSRLTAFGVLFGIAALTVYLLVTGRDLLVPFAIAVVIWYLINALTWSIERRLRVRGWIALSLSIIATLVALWLVAQLISGNISAVSEAAPRYQKNIEKLVDRGVALVGMEKAPSLQQLAKQINVQAALRGVAGAVADVAGSTGLIIVYVLFLLIEQRTFSPKLGALFPDDERQQEIREVLADVNRRVQTYVAVKTLLSIFTGFVSYIVLISVGVDFAAFWAFLIFLLNYIPTVGSLLGVLFPSVLALLQFETITPFVIVAVGLGFAQFLIGNVLEPRMMGKSLNLSPLVVIISLAVWGSIWGVTGMFLCVPITVVMMIVMAEFPQTRPVAILLSADGKI